MPAKRWTVEKVISEFKAFEAQGESIKPGNLKEKRNDLLVQIRRKFGSFENFVKYMGYDYEEVIGFKRWSKQRIIDEVTERHKAGKSVKRQDIEKDDPSLLSAMCGHFGSYKDAITACGFDYESNIGFQWWDAETAKQKFLDIYSASEITMIEDVRRQNRGLDHAIRKHFGGYEQLCSELGLCIDDISKKLREWTAEDLLAVLREMKESGEPLNIMNVEVKFPSVRKVAIKYFGSYENALLEIGERYEDHVESHLQTSYAGKKFEEAVREMFEALGYEYEYHYRGFEGCIPDFYDNTKEEIIDAKLSSWSVFNCKSIEKYTPHCRTLVIVYLRGDEIKHSREDLILRHVSEYYGEIRRRGLSHLIDRFEEIEKIAA